MRRLSGYLAIGLLIFPSGALATSTAPSDQIQGVEVSNVHCLRGNRTETQNGNCGQGDRIAFSIQVAARTSDVVVHFAAYHNETALFGRCLRPKYLRIGREGQSKEVRVSTGRILSFFVPPLDDSPRSFTLWIRVNDATSGELLFEEEKVLSP